jgi:nucleoside-diphosphate-sugar epimerase
MKVFVAGATGVIGRRLVPMLVKSGHSVVGMTRREDEAGRLRSMGAEVAIADAFDGDAVRAALERAAPDAVIDQLTDLSGGSTEANAALRTQGTRNLVDAALAARVSRMVAQSISWAYEPGDEPADERVALDLDAGGPRRTTVLGVAALEGAVREVPDWVVLRYGLLYGPGTWFSAVGSRAGDAHAGRLVADADVTSFVHVDDAASAAIEALDWPSGTVNVCDDLPATGREWAPAFCEAVGAPPPPDGSAERTPWARGADNRHARRELGWTPRLPSWREGFASGL